MDLFVAIIFIDSFVLLTTNGTILHYQHFLHFSVVDDNPENGLYYHIWVEFLTIYNYTSVPTIFEDIVTSGEIWDIFLWNIFFIAKFLPEFLAWILTSIVKHFVSTAVYNFMFI